LQQPYRSYENVEEAVGRVVQEQVVKSKRWRLHPRERRTLLILGDLIIALLALAIALLFWASSAEWYGISFEFLRQRPPAWFFMLPFFWLILLIELYEVHRRVTGTQPCEAF
jgi:hypothetical protein